MYAPLPPKHDVPTVTLVIRIMATLLGPRAAARMTSGLRYQLEGVHATSCSQLLGFLGMGTSRSLGAVAVGPVKSGCGEGG